MIRLTQFPYSPNEFEKEKASYSYLMSLLAFMMGLPLPVINLIATFVFYLAHRKSTLFVRWHCYQALFAQVLFIFINSSGLYWTVSILLGRYELTNAYFSYIISAVIFNILEFAVIIYTAIKVRKGIHVEWWLFGTVTNYILREIK